MACLTYIINKNGSPLMPSKRAGHIRHLLKSGKAKVVLKEPFTIQLLYDATEETQELIVGIDTGSTVVGAAVVNDKNQVLYTSEVQLRQDITKKMDQRRSYRRTRRARKTRHRKARFLNRKNSIKNDRYPPTLRSKFDATVREIEFIEKILPIKNLVLEVGNFDPQLMQHEGEAFNRHWGYQRGPNYGFYNTKARVLDRDSYKCQCCKTKKGSLNVHHIIYKKNGGSDEAENLITLCENCHNKLHHGELRNFETKLQGKRKGNLKHATQMNVLKNMLVKKYPEAITTYGYITKANREAAGLSKEHYLDATIIATGSIDKPVFECNLLIKKCVAKGDYQQTKGVRSEKKIPTNKICGFRKFDKVKYNNMILFIKGRMSSGHVILMDIKGNKVTFNDLPCGWKIPKMVNLKRLAARNSLLIFTKGAYCDE